MAPLFGDIERSLSGMRPRRWGVIAAVILSGSSAQAEPNINLLDLQVFAKRSIRAASSDYQGPTAAGSDIDLVDFRIEGDLTSGRRISMLRGAVTGMVSSPARNLSQVSSGGSSPQPKVALDLASIKLDRVSAKLSSLPATTQVGVSEENNPGAPRRRLRIVARRSLEVAEVSADQLKSHAPGQTTISLEVDEQSRLLVRITGSIVRIHDVGFTMSGGLNPSNITFFFPDATELEISSSGGALSQDGHSLGIPGAVVAPNASLRFASALITGQVFVRDILPISGAPSGQIDKIILSQPDASEARAEFIPSQILQLVDADQSWRCVKE